MAQGSRRGAVERPIVIIPRPIRSGLALTERIAPAVGARILHTLSKFPPRPPERVLARRPEGFTPGRGLRLEVAGVRLAAWEWGEGERLVLLAHGAAGWGHQLAWFVEPLTRRGLRVVTLDWLGHGHSSPVPRRLGPAECLTLWRQLLPRIGPLHAMVAHSAGSIGLFHALDHGATVDKVALLAPRANLDTTFARMVRSAGAGPRTHASLMRLAAQERGVVLDHFDGPRHAPRWGHIPALIIHGEADVEVPISEVESIADAWPGATLMRAGGGLGHLSILRDPAVIGRVTDFVADE